MGSSHLFYLPAELLLYILLGGLLFVLLVLLQLGLLNRAYRRVGLEPRVALLVLLASLVGSYINIPLFQLPDAPVVTRHAYIDFFGMPYYVPQLVDWPGVIVAVNVGGAVIPTLLSIYLVFHNRVFLSAAIAMAVVAFVVHQLATPVPGVGISVPLLAPPLLAAVTAVILSRQYAAALAYVGGCMGVLIGADLMNLDKLQSLGAPVASIGGAGAFDGVFVTGVVAVLLSGIGDWRRVQPS
ncbi:MAG: DUF1614 domain-containing protein [Hyphomicrobiales bacterium]|nr:DUF1614 domain-containing protein [Hyphomicrobiales bacterium]